MMLSIYIEYRSVQEKTPFLLSVQNVILCIYLFTIYCSTRSEFIALSSCIFIIYLNITCINNIKKENGYLLFCPPCSLSFYLSLLLLIYIYCLSKSLDPFQIVTIYELSQDILNIQYTYIFSSFSPTLS